MEMYQDYSSRMENYLEFFARGWKCSWGYDFRMENQALHLPDGNVLGATDPEWKCTQKYNSWMEMYVELQIPDGNEFAPQLPDINLPGATSP